MKVQNEKDKRRLRRKRNEMARELRTPKYRQRRVEDKRKRRPKHKKKMIEDYDETIN